MELKISVDKKAKKVVFAEAGKEFVDFLAQIMSLPLSSVSKLLKEKGMMGCVGDLYKSMESLHCEFYEAYSKKNAVLDPTTFVTVPLLSLNVSPIGIDCYTCEKHNTNFSDRENVDCPSCKGLVKMSTKYSRNYAPISGYVKDKVIYIVTDNLEVQPMSVSIIKSFFKDYGPLEDKQVEVGPDEGLAILKASMERQDVLTSVFLPRKEASMKRQDVLTSVYLPS